MSFKPFQFIYTPPPTVPEPDRSQVVVSGGSESSSSAEGVATASSFADTSRAGELISILDGLSQTSDYLQAIVLSQTATMGIEIDPRVDPDTSMAMIGIYGQAPPTTITVPMYARLLDADIGVMQLEMATGSASSIEPNPVQAAQVSTVTRNFERYLLADGSYKAALPLMLRTLKGDKVIYSQWSRSLSQYPAFVTASQPTPLAQRAPSSTSLLDLGLADVNDPLFRPLLDFSQKMSAVYGAEYGLVSSLNHVEADVAHVANAYFYEPLENLLRMIGLFNSLRAMVHTPRLTDLASDLSNFVYSRLASEIGGYACELDRLTQYAIDPLRAAFGPVQGIVGTIAGVFNTVTQIAGTGEDVVNSLRTGSLRGMFSYNPCSRENPLIPQRSSPGGSSILDSIPAGLQALASHLDWAQREAQRAIDSTASNLERLLANRLRVHQDRTDLMCSLSSLDSMVGLARGFINEFQRGTSASGGATAEKLEVLSRILNNLDTPTGSTFSVVDGEVLASPPNVPAMPPAVESTFKRGGITSFRGPTSPALRGALNV